MKFLYGWNVYIIYSMYIKVMSILSFLPLLFLSQSLVFIAVVFIVIIFWLSVSSSFSFHSWCYWVFLFVCENTIISFLIFTFPHAVPSLFSFRFLFAFSFLFLSNIIMLYVYVHVHLVCKDLCLNTEVSYLETLNSFSKCVVPRFLSITTNKLLMYWMTNTLTKTSIGT